MRPFLVLALALAVGCRNDFDLGTSVGNPSPTKLTIAPDEGATLRYGQLHVDTLELDDCDGGTEVRIVDAIFNPLHDAFVVIPPGTWCGMELNLAAPIDLSGDLATGGVHELYLYVPIITLATTDLTTGGDPLVLELAQPGWLSAWTPAEGDFVVEGDGEVHDALALQFSDASALFTDDGDFVVSEAERAAGSVARGPAREEEDDVGGVD